MEDSDLIEASQLMAVALAKLPAPLRVTASRLENPILHSACAAGELDLVLGLLNAGLAPDMYPCSGDEEDEPPLTWIARYRDRSSPGALAVAELLIQRGAGIDEGLPLLAALMSEDLSMTRLLLRSGADPASAFVEADQRETALLQQVLALGWDTQSHPGGDYYFAFDNDQNPLAIGDSHANAMNAGMAIGGNNGVNVWPATERLVARFLSGEDICWEGNGVADLEEEQDVSWHDETE